MKLYTRTGDDGSTGLYGGDRVRKDNARIEAYGAVDELNASLGFALAGCEFDDLRDVLVPIQSRLFDVGADLATRYGSAHESNVARLADEQVVVLEEAIDKIDGQNDEIRTFVMPGGTELAARLHMARATCRRAERAIVCLGADEEINQVTVLFLNRLSDLLFACARLANKLAGVGDVPWQPGATSE